MKNALSTLREAAGTGALLIAAGSLVIGGYLFFTSLGDLKRYIRISTM